MRRIFPAILLGLLFLGGCHKKSAVKAPSPPPQPAQADAPTAVTPTVKLHAAPLEAPLGKTISAPNNFELGLNNFKLGNYTQAEAELEQFLKNNANDPEREPALFYLGLSRVLPSEPNRDIRRAAVAFKQLISEFPNSYYKTEAELILGLQSQIEKLRSDVKERDDRVKKLSDELKVLKEIDLQRRPSRVE